MTLERICTRKWRTLFLVVFSCVALVVPWTDLCAQTRGDFDGDGKADIAVWRPSSGTWFILPSSNPSNVIIKPWGANGDIPVPGDYDGDGKTDMAVWRPSSGTWFIFPSSNPGNVIIQPWGASGDIPVPGDYDGDKKTDMAVFRPSTGSWFIRPSSTPGTPTIQPWGTSGDIPVPGDYDGDGKTDMAVWRPSTGQWFIIPSSNPGTPIIQPWGVSGDIPVPADYDGDKKTDIAVFRPSSGTWFILRSSTPGTPTVQQWGASTDIPVPGDYDGDGKTDIAVWRPSIGTWFVIPSSAPTTPTGTPWGTLTDVPAQKRIEDSGISAIPQIGSFAVAGFPSSVLVDEIRNKIYVADVSGGTIQVFDGNTHQLLRTITECAGVFDGQWVIDQAFGRIYAGCGVQGTTGVKDGDGKIRVIDTASDMVISVLDIGTSRAVSDYRLAIDETRHKVWISQLDTLHGNEIAVINVPTNVVAFINTAGAKQFGSLSVNETTNRIYVVRTQFQDVLEIDGNTLSISRSLSVPFFQPVQSGINRRENKLYVVTIFSSGASGGLCIYNMRQVSPACTSIASNSWAGIVTNERTDLVYLGVDFGFRIGILDGAFDRLTEIPMDPGTGEFGYTNQSHKIVVNETTDHTFFVNNGFLLALDGPTQQIRKIAYADVDSSRGAQAIRINRSNNQIYVLYGLNKVAVFQDR